MKPYNYNNQMPEWISAMKLDTAQTALEIKGREFATLGNLSLIIDKTRTREMLFATFAMAACSRPLSAEVGQQLENTGFKGLLPPAKKQVVLVNTKQSMQQALHTARRVCELIGTDLPENFDMYNLKHQESHILIIDEIIAHTPNLGLLVIDGAGAMVTDVSNAEQAKTLVSDLLMRAEDRQIHIAAVLRTGRASYLSTELMYKAQTSATVVTVDSQEAAQIKDGYIDYAGKFKPFTFHVNGDRLPELP